MTEEEVVSAQLEAYNKRNIDSFMAVWAEDSKYYEHPDTLLASGYTAIRERHTERFKDKDLYGKLHSRIVIGNKVIDHETVTRNFPEGLRDIDVLVIYEIQKEKIQNAWFIFGNKSVTSGKQT